MSNHLQDTVRRNMVTFLVSKAITCPRTGEVLDARNCVVFVDSDGDPAAVMSQDGYTEFANEATAVGTSPDARLAHLGLTVDPLSVK